MGRTRAFGTALNCMDGRTHRVVLDWFAHELGIEHVDLVTEPGIVRLLAEGDHEALRPILEKLALSRDAHGSRVVAVVAHDDCAGNPVPAVEQRSQLAVAVQRVASALPGVVVRGLWIAEGFDSVEVVK